MKPNTPLNLQYLPTYGRPWLKSHQNKAIEYTQELNSNEIERQSDLFSDYKANLDIQLDRSKSKLSDSIENFETKNPGCSIKDEALEAILHKEKSISNSDLTSHENYRVKNSHISVGVNNSGPTVNLNSSVDIGDKIANSKTINQTTINKYETTTRVDVVAENADAACKNNIDTNSDFEQYLEASIQYKNIKSKLDSLQQRQEHYQEYINHLNNPDNGDGTLRFRTDKTNVTIHLVDKTGVPATPGELPNDNLILMYESKEDGWFKKSNYRLDADGVLDRDVPTLNEVLGVQHPIAENKTSANDQEALHAQHVAPEVNSSEIHHADNATNNLSTEETADEIFKRIIAETDRGVRGPGNDGPDFC